MPDKSKPINEIEETCMTADPEIQCCTCGAIQQINPHTPPHECRQEDVNRHLHRKLTNLETSVNRRMWLITVSVLAAAVAILSNALLH